MISRTVLIPLSVFLLCLSVTVVTPVSAQVDPEVVAGMFSWREVGPANPGGRITDVEGVESRPSTLYIGTATGGMWKTVNAGITWEPIFDDQPNASIGDIGLSQSNPEILYVGTGEPNNRNSSPWGAGVFKTTDGGESWEFIGLKETHHIGRIIVHPTDPDIVYLAAMGHLWGTNEERGVYRTTDGGRNWEKVFYIDDRNGATDLAMDPADTDILYVAIHDRLRDRFDAGDPVERWGPLAGIYMTRDGGENWTRCLVGLPTEDMGRIGIATARSRPGTIYALIGVKPPPRDPNAPRSFQQPGAGADETLDPNRDGIWRSDDYGATWEKVNNWNNRPSYYSQIRVDPNDAEVIWAFGSPMAYSDDGGRTVISGRPVQGSTHIDYHSCWIDPNNSDHVVVGGDGGINITWDRGKNWEVVKEIGLAQFYAITADMRKPYYLVGGLQDNGVWIGASRGRITRGVTNADWFALSNADGFFCQVDPTDFNTVYAETQGGSIYRHDLRTGQANRGIRPRPPAPSEGSQRERYRTDWNTPYLISPHNPRTLYYGANKVLKTINRGDHWQAISPDLTAEIDDRNSAIVSLAESPIMPGLLWVGTNDGNVQLSRNDGATWTLLNDNIPGAPARYWVKRIEASHHEPGRAYLVFDGHRHDDQAPYVFMTDDFGQSWSNITGNLPEGSCYVIREDFVNPDLLFVAPSSRSITPSIGARPGRDS